MSTLVADRPGTGTGPDRTALGTAALVASSLFEITAGVVMGVALARLLGVEGFGVLSWALAWCILPASLSDIGLTILAAKLVARAGRDWRSKLAGLLTVKLLAAAAVCGLWFAGWLASPRVRTHWVLLATLLASELLRGFAVFFCFALRGLGRAHIEAMILGAERAVLTVLAIAAAWTGHGVPGVAAAFVAARLLSAVLAFLTANPFAHGIPAGCGSARGQWRNVAVSLRLGLHPLMERILGQGSSLVLMARSAVEVGFFQAAFRIVMVPYMVSAALAGSLIAPLSAASVTDRRRYSRIAKVGMFMNRNMSIGSALAILACGQPIVRAVFGVEYLDAWEPLRWLAIYVAAVGVYHICVCALPGIDEETFMARVLAGGMAAAVVILPLASLAGGTAGIAGAVGLISLGAGLVLLRPLAPFLGRAVRTAHLAACCAVSALAALSSADSHLPGGDGIAVSLLRGTLVFGGWLAVAWRIAEPRLRADVAAFAASAWSAVARRRSAT